MSWPKVEQQWELASTPSEVGWSAVEVSTLQRHEAHWVLAEKKGAENKANQK
jgi:hypothetical protein